MTGGAPPNTSGANASEHNSRAKGPSGKETSGQGAGQERSQLNRDEDRDRTTGQNRMGQDRDSRPGASTSSSSSSTSSATSGSASLTSEQRTRIHQTIVGGGSAPRVANVDFSISVGTTVPRSVRLVSVPAAIIEIQPAWRGYEYFVVGDQVVIVDPATMQIVAVISA
jgi:hypothetical protein